MPLSRPFSQVPGELITSDHISLRPKPSFLLRFQAVSSPSPLPLLLPLRFSLLYPRVNQVLRPLSLCPADPSGFDASPWPLLQPQTGGGLPGGPVLPPSPTRPRPPVQASPWGTLVNKVLISVGPVRHSGTVRLQMGRCPQMFADGGGQGGRR